MTKTLDELRQVAERATPGPWRFDTDSEEDYEVGIPYSEWPQTLYGPKNSCPSEWAVRVGATHQIDEINELTWEDVTHIATFDPSTVLGLIERVEAAEQALDFHTQRDRELKTLLSVLSDRLDEYCYDELSSLIEDEPLNQWGESYTSKLQSAERERDEWRGKYDEAESARTDTDAAVARVEDVLSKDAFSVQEDGFCADDLVDCDEIRAALKGPTSRQRNDAEKALRELHEEVWTDDPAPGGFVCKECGVPVESKPCDVIRALDGGE